MMTPTCSFDPDAASELPLMAIVGATGVGKNALAQQIAELAGATLISVDSRKVYRGLDIGTAKPTREAQERFHYGMIDCADPSEPFSAGRYAREARQIVAARRAAGQPVILVGGTGFYLDALIRGLPDLPPPDAGLRTEIIAHAGRDGWLALHAELVRLDPVWGSHIDPHDKIRLLRAWELIKQTGELPSTFFAAAGRTPLPWPIIVVWVDMRREELHDWIERRVHRMVQAGLFDEVRGLLDRGYGPESPGMATVGYAESIRHVSGQLEATETIAMIVHNTRRYAKRQITWFRHRPYALCLDAQDATPQRVIAMWRGPIMT